MAINTSHSCLEFRMSVVHLWVLFCGWDFGGAGWGAWRLVFKKCCEVIQDTTGASWWHKDSAQNIRDELIMTPG